MKLILRWTVESKSVLHVTGVRICELLSYFTFALTVYIMYFVTSVLIITKNLHHVTLTQVYSSTPLIHKAVNSYRLDSLRPGARYEVAIYFIPFPGQTTELQATNRIKVETLPLPGKEFVVFINKFLLFLHNSNSKFNEIFWIHCEIFSTFQAFHVSHSKVK